MASSRFKDMFATPRLQLYPETPPILPRPKPMRLLVLGLSRSGTSSMCAALKILGMAPYHFVEVNRNVKNGHFELWLEAIRAKYDDDVDGGNHHRTAFAREDFDQMLWNYDAVADAPACLFPDELLAAYPSAKVVLTTRPAAPWLASMRATILAVLSWRSWTLLARLDPAFSGPYWALFNRATDVWSAGAPAWRRDAATDAALLRAHEEYYAHVRSGVPRERLLEFHPRDGWGPLCEFLGEEVPKEAFPHVNEGRFFIGEHRRVYWWRWRRVVADAAPTVAAAALVVAVAAWKVQGGRFADVGGGVLAALRGSSG